MATPVTWDLVSSVYAEEIVPVFEQYARDALRLAAPPAGARIADVACGPGTLAFVAAAAGHPVDAIDFSPQMIALLERRLQQQPAPITARIGDGQALPFADATYGAAFSMFGLMFFPDRAAGFRELRRVLVPGGKAVVSSWPRFEDNHVMSSMFSALREMMGKALGAATPKFGTQEMPLVTPELCKQEMSAVFADVEVHSITHTQRFGSASEMWKSIERTLAPVVLMRKNLGEERWAPLGAAAEQAIVKAVGSGPPELNMPAWLTVGTAR
jgi:ubiquinone/menaquinone biosynthesis C-methylase UbiE